MIENHAKDLMAVLDQLGKHDLLVAPNKAQLFMKKVEFCGHVLTEGKRMPAPGKLMALQKWELPPVVTMLRGFLGACNYYATYVKDYASLAGPLYANTNSLEKIVKRVLKSH